MAELELERSEFEAHFAESIEAFEQAAQSAVGEAEREHERSRLQLEEALTEGAQREREVAELRVECDAAHAERTAAQAAIEAACHVRTDHTCTKPHFYQTPLLIFWGYGKFSQDSMTCPPSPVVHSFSEGYLGERSFSNDARPLQGH